MEVEITDKRGYKEEVNTERRKKRQKKRRGRRGLCVPRDYVDLEGVMTLCEGLAKWGLREGRMARRDDGV